MAHAQAGDEIVCSAAIYGGTLHLLEDLLTQVRRAARGSCRSRSSREPERRDRRRGRGSSGSSRRSTRRCAAWTSGAIAAACRARGVLSVIDNTFASPINQQPLALGVDLVDAERHEVSERPQRRHRRRGHRPGGAGRRRSSRTRRLVGTVMDPYPAYALGRGLKTLPLRIARHNANAQAVARVSRRPTARVSQVYYPGLAVASRSRDRASGR